MSPRVPMPADADDEPEDGPTDVSVSVVEEGPRLVDGRYRLIRELGRGGMSTVYLAEHVDLRRQVALKIFMPPTSSAAEVDFAEWFRREARTLASIQHPNVVTLHDFGRLYNDAFFLAMEYVDGPSLTDVLRDGPLDPQHAARLVVQVCLALRHTHQRGVVHRDIKPSNLLIARDLDGGELVKVIDFGIAEGGEDASDDEDDILVGSPHCMSPEQIEGRAAGPASDIYGTGVVLYRALTGRWPFAGATRRETLVAHLVGTLPPLSEAAPDVEVPPELEAVVRRCLARDPADRYPDMDALLDDLAAFLHLDGSALDSQGLPAAHAERTGSFVRTGTFARSGVLRRPGPAPAEPAPRRTSPLLLGALGLAVVAAAGALVFLLAGSSPTPEPARASAAQVGAAPSVADAGSAEAAEGGAPPPAEAPPTEAPPAEAPPTKAPPAADPPPAEPVAAPAPPPRSAPARAPTTRPASKAPRAASGSAEATPRSTTPAPSSPPADRSGEDEVPEGYKGMPDF